MTPRSIIFISTIFLGTSSAQALDIGPSSQVPVGSIGPNAEIVFLRQKPGPPGGISDVYVCDRSGGNLTQITFNSVPKEYEHVAVSPDRTRVVVNYWIRQPRESPRSLLWLLDLKNKSETQLVPSFHSAGDGGVDWDLDGYVYFAAEPSRAAPRTPPKRSIYKIKYDGTGLQRLTNTEELNADVSVSEDGTMMTYVKAVPRPPRPYTEIWVANTDGTNQRLVYRSGPIGVGSAHDPELSPDNKKIVFSKVNPDYRNFPNVQALNTAHDIYVINIDGTGLRKISLSGGIQIMPDWVGQEVIYTDLDERDDYQGMSVIDAQGGGRKRIGPAGARVPKWIPRR